VVESEKRERGACNSERERKEKRVELIFFFFANPLFSNFLKKLNFLFH